MESVQDRAVDLGLLVSRQSYDFDKEKGYKALLQPQGMEVLLVVRNYDEKDNLALAQSYAEKQSQILDSRLLQYVSYTSFPNDDQSFDLYLGLENQDQDLITDLNRRNVDADPYPEAFIFQELKILVGTLASLQRTGVAHRNITPVSLFLTDSGLKLGLIGTPQFEVLDRKLRGESICYIPPARRQQAQKRLENPYKSDVFALGVCVLAMCLLRTPDIREIESLEERVAAEIDICTASPELKEVLRHMLIVNDISRPDFLQLEAFLAAPPAVQQMPVPKVVSVPLCMKCGNALPEADLTPSGSFEQPVRLWCDPCQHVFCSRKCFSEFLSSETQNFALDVSIVQCKLCNTSIDLDLIHEAVGGRDIFDRMVAEARYDRPLCCICKRLNVEVFQLSCKDYYCKDDLRTWIRYYKQQPKECSKCHTEISKEELQEVYNPRYRSTQTRT